MYTFEIDYNTQMKVQELLKTKEGVCEVMPKVRITNHEGRYSTRVELVCVHKDSSINCGTNAKDCTNCLNKDEVYQSNKSFNKAMGEVSRKLINLINS